MNPLRSLVGRVTVSALVATAVALLGGGIAVVVAADRSDRSALDRDLNTLVGRLAQPAGGLVPPPPGQGPPPGAPARESPLDPAGDRFARVVVPGRQTQSAGAAVPPGFPLTPAGKIVTVHAGGKDWRTLTVQLPRGGARLQAAIDLSTIEDRADRLRTIVAIVVAAGLLATGLLAYALARVALGPLQELRAGSHRIAGTGDPSERLDIDEGPVEVRELADDLDVMLARIEAAMSSSRRFAADAGHELRTPLTSLRANLSAGAVDAAEVDAERLAGLVAQLQALARGESGPPARTEPVELDDLADAALAALRARHPSVHAELHADEGPVTVSGDADGLRGLLDNLLENAAVHGRADGRITVEVAPDGAGRARVVVDDDGPGIPPEERAAVLGRFVRGAGATAAGSGLGLAIADAQAVRHGGTLTLDDSPLGGLRVRVVLPVG